MVKAKLENLGVEAQSGNVVALLRAETGEILPIWIGPLEAQNIAVAMAGEKPPRPLTPDLLLSVMEMLGGKLKRIEITELKDGTYYARLVIDHRGIDYEIDARPSDAMALAARTGVDILIDEKVLEEGKIEETDFEPHGPTPEA